MRGWIIAALIALLSAASPLHAQSDAFDAEGYRIAHYRAPVSGPPEGVGRIVPAAAAQLRPGRDALFIDVLPAEGGHRQEDGRWRLARPRDSIPGAHWFPEAGRGALAPDIAPWFSTGIARLTGGNKDRMLILFCLSDCWMSWNAARRLHAMGYRNIWWLAEGTDGWRDLSLPLARVEPEGGVVP